MTGCWAWSALQGKPCSSEPGGVPLRDALLLRLRAHGPLASGFTGPLERSLRQVLDLGFSLPSASAKHLHMEH